MWPNLSETTDLVTFTEKILNWKLHFLRSVMSFVNNDFFIICESFAAWFVIVYKIKFFLWNIYI